METYLFKFPQTVSVALEVLCGKYGNNSERKCKLESEGYNYQTVQSCVNDLVKLLDKYGDK